MTRFEQLRDLVATLIPYLILLAILAVAIIGLYTLISPLFEPTFVDMASAL